MLILLNTQVVSSHTHFLSQKLQRVLLSGIRHLTYSFPILGLFDSYMITTILCNDLMLYCT